MALTLPARRHEQRKQTRKKNTIHWSIEVQGKSGEANKKSHWNSILFLYFGRTVIGDIEKWGGLCRSQRIWLFSLRMQRKVFCNQIRMCVACVCGTEEHMLLTISLALGTTKIHDYEFPLSNTRFPNKLHSSCYIHCRHSNPSTDRVRFAPPATNTHANIAMSMHSLLLFPAHFVPLLMMKINKRNASAHWNNNPVDVRLHWYRARWRGAAHCRSESHQPRCLRPLGRRDSARHSIQFYVCIEWCGMVQGNKVGWHLLKQTDKQRYKTSEHRINNRFWREQVSKHTEWYTGNRKKRETQSATKWTTNKEWRTEKRKTKKNGWCRFTEFIIISSRSLFAHLSLVFLSQCIRVYCTVVQCTMLMLFFFIQYSTCAACAFCYIRNLWCINSINFIFMCAIVICAWRPSNEIRSVANFICFIFYSFVSESGCDAVCVCVRWAVSACASTDVLYFCSFCFSLPAMQCAPWPWSWIQTIADARARWWMNENGPWWSRILHLLFAFQS